MFFTKSQWVKVGSIIGLVLYSYLKIHPKAIMPNYISISNEFCIAGGMIMLMVNDWKENKEK